MWYERGAAGNREGRVYECSFTSKHVWLIQIVRRPLSHPQRLYRRHGFRRRHCVHRAVLRRERGYCVRGGVHVVYCHVFRVVVHVEVSFSQFLEPNRHRIQRFPHRAVVR